MQAVLAGAPERLLHSRPSSTAVLCPGVEPITSAHRMFLAGWGLATCRRDVPVPESHSRRSRRTGRNRTGIMSSRPCACARWPTGAATAARGATAFACGGRGTAHRLDVDYHLSSRARWAEVRLTPTTERPPAGEAVSPRPGSRVPEGIP